MTFSNEVSKAAASAAKEALVRRALEYHSMPERGPTCGSMALDMELIFDGLAAPNSDGLLELTDAGKAMLTARKAEQS